MWDWNLWQNLQNNQMRIGDLYDENSDLVLQDQKSVCLLGGFCGYLTPDL